MNLNVSENKLLFTVSNVLVSNRENESMKAPTGKYVRSFKKMKRAVSTKGLLTLTKKSIMKDFEPEINHWLNTIMPKWHRLNRDLYTKLSFISNLIFKITYLIFISICFIFHDGIIINLFNTIYFGLFDVVAEYKRSCNWYTSNCPITLDQRESF